MDFQSLDPILGKNDNLNMRYFGVVLRKYYLRRKHSLSFLELITEVELGALISFRLSIVSSCCAIRFVIGILQTLELPAFFHPII